MKKYLIILEFSILIILFKIIITDNENNNNNINNNNFSNNSGFLFRIFGNSSILNYYYINIYLGSPPKKQSVIIDTGSHITTVPCLPYCEKCGKHLNSYYIISSKFIYIYKYLLKKIEI